MNRSCLITAVAAALLLLPASAVGQKKAHEKREKVRDKRDAKREQVRDKRDAKRERVRDKRDAKREQVRDKRDAKREQVRDKRDAKRERLRDKRDAKRERREGDLEKRAPADMDRAEVRPKLRRKRNHKRFHQRYKRLRTKTFVSGFRPEGKRVVVRGLNFPADATVTIDGKPIKAKVTPTRIAFDAAISGTIVVTANGASFVVGTLADELTDAAALKKRRAERRKRAKERIKARWKLRAKTKAERKKNHENRLAGLEATRVARAEKRAATIRAKFKAAFLASDPAQAELALHAARRARLVRMQKLADIDDRDKLALRIEILLEKEDERHKARMTVLRKSFASGGKR